jgi:hypothetical protein
MNALNFGTLGRCGCGAIGKRHTHLTGEPICSPCLQTRRGGLHVVDGRGAHVGTLTPAQRRARVILLRADIGAFEEGLTGYPNDTQQPPARQTRRARGE